MANFRTERLSIRVSDIVDFDPNEGIDPVELADVYHDVMLRHNEPFQIDRESLSDRLHDLLSGSYHGFMWHPAATGLQVIRDLIDHFQKKDATAERERFVATLRAVEACLDLIDSRDLKFHFLARDLPAAKSNEESREARPVEPPTKPRTVGDEKLSEEELIQILGAYENSRGGRGVVMEQGIREFDQVGRQLCSLLESPELAEFWAAYFEVTPQHYQQWLEAGKSLLQDRSVVDHRCMEKTKSGQQCKRKALWSDSPRLFFPGHTDRCKQHRRPLTSLEAAEQREIRDKAERAWRWREVES